MKKLLVFGLVLVVVAIAGIAIYLSDFSVNNLLPKSPLPKKYESYKEIGKGISSKNYRSLLLFSSDNELRLDEFPPLFNAKDSTVIVARQTEKKIGGNTNLWKTYLKLDSNGDVVDSLTFKEEWPTDLGGFLITKIGYCSWMLDGKKERIPYAEENSNLTEDSASLALKYKKLYQAAQYVFYFSHYDLDDKRLESLEIDKAVFCIDGHWIALLGKNIDDLDNQVRVKGASPVSDMANSAKRHIHLEHFQKENYHKSRRLSWGDPNGNSTTDYWQGSGYFNIIVHQDTLCFKQPLDKENDQAPNGSSSYRLTMPQYYYSNEKLGFVLFTNKNYELYLIKKNKWVTIQ